MKKKLLALAVSLMLLASAVIGCVCVFAASVDPDYVDGFNELADGLINAGLSLETDNPLHGTKSLAFNMDVSTATNSTWLGGTPITGYYDFTNVDYFGFRVKNTDTANNIGVCLLIDFVDVDNGNAVCRYIPTWSYDSRLFDTAGNEVQANTMATIGNGIGCNYVDIPAGFEGFVFFYMKDDTAFENKASYNRRNAPYDHIASVAPSFQADDAFHGKLIFDDAQYMTSAELAAMAGNRLLVDVDETKDIIRDCFGTNIGGGGYSAEKGETMVRFPLPASSTSNLMQVYVGDVLGYEYFSFRLINDSDEELPFISTGYSDMVLNSQYTLYDEAGAPVGGASTYNGLVIPARFDGWVTFSLINSLCQGGAAYSRVADDATPVLHPWQDNFAGKYLDPKSAGYFMLNVNSPTNGNTAVIFVGDIMLHNGNPVFGDTTPAISRPLNFVVKNNLNNLVSLSLPTEVPYGNAGFTNGVGEIVELAGGDYAIRLTKTDDDYTIVKLACASLGGTVAAFDPAAVAVGFMVQTGDQPVDFWQIQTPEGGAYVGNICRLYTATGLYVKELLFGASGDCSIPANFTGYLYFPIDDTARNAIDFSTLLFWMNGASGSSLTVDNFGYYYAEPEMAQIIGVQESAVSSGTFDVRVLAGLDDLAFNSLKFVYNATLNGAAHWATDQEIVVTEVYETVQIAGIADANAVDYGYAYLGALTFQGIPATGTVAITVKLVSASEADPAFAVESAAYVITYVDGVFQSMVNA
ncbi:MAG: hypothetical protein KIG36_04045 [Eubacteriales bacterium]|nr:hypothetical protein [Eubacteriales bacterium]